MNSRCARFAIHAPSWLTSLVAMTTGWANRCFGAVRAMRRMSCAACAITDVLKDALSENRIYRRRAARRDQSERGHAGIPPYDERRPVLPGCLGEASGQEIDGEEHLFELMKQLVRAKREYDRVSAALDSVRETGYGMVSPDMSEMTLSEPEIVAPGRAFRRAIEGERAFAAYDPRRHSDGGQPDRRHGKAIRGAGQSPFKRG